MERHSHRNPVNGKFAKLPTGSQPHKTHSRGGKSDTDREMESNRLESERYSEGRWDQDAEVNASVRDGLDKSSDWKGRGNTVAGAYQGSQHRRAHQGYDVQEHAKVSAISNYAPENAPHFPEVKPPVFDARANTPRPKPQPGNEHESFLTTGS